MTPEAKIAMTDALLELDRLVGSHGAAALLEREGRPAVDADMRRVVARLCAEARERDARRAERLVLSLRAAWPSLPSVRRLQQMDGGSHAAVLLNRIVSECIRAFHRPALVMTGGDAAAGSARRA